MPAIFKSPVNWVDDGSALRQAIGEFSKNRLIGVDTESNSLYAYQEQVCLIQFSDHRSDYLVDPLADINLSPLGAIFSNERIEKIFHAAEYDILCLKRDFGFQFNNLFDTMQAARVLGMEKLGLSSLLEDFFHIDPGKSFQKANWGKRPLSDEMRFYARMDTHYLIGLRNILAKQLEKKNLMELAQEDFQRLCRVQPNRNDQPLYTHVSGYHLLKPDSLAVLDELCKFRDRLSKKKNRPHFKIIGNKYLLSIAEYQPKNPEQLREIPGMSSKVANRYETDLLGAVMIGLANSPIKLEKRRRPPQSYIDRLNALQDWRKKTGRKMGVQSDIVLPRDIMEEIAAKSPKDPASLKQLMREAPWRFGHFKREILLTIMMASSP